MQDNLYFEILNGPQAGQLVKIQAGLRIGRSQGEFKIQDPRISSLHAQVIKHSKGVLVLLDQKSSNKIVFNGEKVEKLALMPGIQFLLGSTQLIVSHKPKEASPTQNLNATDLNVSESDNTFSFLADLTQHLSLGQHKSSPDQLIFFDLPLWLDFVQGPEFGRKVGMIYGPRLIGRETTDIRIYELSCPPTAFTLNPIFSKLRAFEFKTPYPALVRINGEAALNKVVEEGCYILIGKTKINLYFSEER